MTTQHFLFDKERPIYFGWVAIEKFESLTGITFSKMGDALQNMSASTMIDFCYAGLYGGAKKERIEVDFERDDVAEWLDEVKDLSKMIEAFVACMPMAGNETKKKPITQKTKI